MKSKSSQFDPSVVLINKQAGRTSHDEVAIIKSAFRKIGLKIKVGHSGTLDPKVTGLLVVGIGKGTKVLEYMLLSEKRYIGEMIFHDYVTREQLEDAIKKFTGSIKQLPPQKSSVKRVLRTREIYGIEIKDFDYEDKKAQLFCAVERGTYIRKLFHDMGEYMGVRSHMGDLHRTVVGPFSETEGVVTSDDLHDTIIFSQSINPITKYFANKKLFKTLLPISKAAVMFPKVILHPGVESFLASGSDLYIPGIESIEKGAEKGDKVGMYAQDGNLIAIGILDINPSALEKQEKGVGVITKKVLI